MSGIRLPGVTSPGDRELDGIGRELKLAHAKTHKQDEASQSSPRDCTAPEPASLIPCGIRALHPAGRDLPLRAAGICSQNASRPPRLASFRSWLATLRSRLATFTSGGASFNSRGETFNPRVASFPSGQETFTRRHTSFPSRRASQIPRGEGCTPGGECLPPPPPV
jgi:hypothetical protein